MLWNAKNMLIAWERDVQGDGLRPFWLAVCEALELLCPPLFRIPFLQLSRSIQLAKHFYQLICVVRDHAFMQATLL